LSVFTCPACHGTLWEVEEDGVLRFRCRVGHVYSPESMLAAQSDSVDRALWTAVRTLEERAAFMQRMATRAHRRKQPFVHRMYAERSIHAIGEADAIRRVLTSRVAGHDVPDHAADTPGPGDIEANATATPEPLTPREPIE
jgi:two-component system chemotaxis response regulator CheB